MGCHKIFWILTFNKIININETKIIISINKKVNIKFMLPIKKYKIRIILKVKQKLIELFKRRNKYEKSPYC